MRAVHSRLARLFAACAFGACVASLGGLAAATSPASARVPAARVQGRFTMHAVVTSAFGVRGEHRGERLSRTWRIRPGDCRSDVCTVLHVRRTRGGGRRLWLTLHRLRDGEYSGQGAFFVAVSCRGRVHPRGALAPYEIRLRVTTTRIVGGVRFAQGVAATYVNRTRIDRTGCSLQPSYDAARYSGRLQSGLPSAPRPAFTATAGQGGLVSFAGSSAPGTGPGGSISAYSWDFGDPASGPADSSALPAPTHQYPAPGSYVVRLTAVDQAGLAGSVEQTVVVPAPPPPAALSPWTGAPWRAPR